MSILDRLQRLARAEWSALRGDSARRELETAIREAEAAVADLRASERVFHADYQDQLDRVQAHEDAAAAAVGAGDDAAARGELWARQQALEKADAARSRLERVRRQIDEAVGMLRGARSQASLDALDLAPSVAPPDPKIPVVPVVPGRAAPLPPAYAAGARDAAHPLLVADPYATRAPTQPAPAPTTQDGRVAEARPRANKGAPLAGRFDEIGRAPLDVPPDPAGSRIDKKLDHFEQIAARIDRAEAEASLDPAQEARRTEAAIGDAFRRLEVERLRSAANPDEDGALDRLRQRMGEGPSRD